MKPRAIAAVAVLAVGLTIPATAQAADSKLRRLVFQASARTAQINTCSSTTCFNSGINRVLVLDGSMVDRARSLMSKATPKCRYWLKKVDDRPVVMASRRFFNQGNLAAANHWASLQHTLMARALRASTVC